MHYEQLDHSRPYHRGKQQQQNRDPTDVMEQEGSSRYYVLGCTAPPHHEKRTLHPIHGYMHYGMALVLCSVFAGRDRERDDDHNKQNKHYKFNFTQNKDVFYYGSMVVWGRCACMCVCYPYSVIQGAAKMGKNRILMNSCWFSTEPIL